MPSAFTALTAAALTIGLLAGVQACVDPGERRTSEFGSGAESNGEDAPAPDDANTPSTPQAPGVSLPSVDELPTGRVASITDGDTLRLVVDGRELRVRLTGIDTPEVYPDVECFGPEATDALTSLAPVGSTLAYEYDLDSQDPFDRELMYLFTLDGTFINLELVAEGYATELHYAPNFRYRELIQSAEQDAASADLGLWGACR